MPEPIDPSEAIKAIKNPKIEEVTPAEQAIAFSGPAYSVNKFFINIGANGVRIAFTEVNEPSPAVFRTAVNLSIPDAFALSSILRDLLDRSVKIEAFRGPQDEPGVQIAPAPPAAT